jgi:4-amino-4-deoxy-L-arabinose transferase-like glycosyltransferase
MTTDLSSGLTPDLQSSSTESIFVDHMSNKLESSARAWLHIACVVLIAIAARGAYTATRGIKKGGDTWSYLLLARNLSDHGTFSLSTSPPCAPTIRRAPLYPAFLAGIDVGGGSLEAKAVVVQIALDSAVAAMVYVLAAMVTRPRWALTVAITYAILPEAITASCIAQSETLFVFLQTAAVLCLLMAVEHARPGMAAIAAVLIGMAALSRPIALFVPPLLAAAILMTPQVARRWIHATIFVGGSIITIAPWVARCSLLAGTIIPIQGASVASFYIPTLWQLDQRDGGKVWPYFDEIDPYGTRLVAARNPAEFAAADRFGRRLLVSNIRKNPTAYLKSRLKNFPRLFLSNCGSFTGIQESMGQLWRQRDFPPIMARLTLLFVFSLLPLAFGIAGLFRMGSNLTARFSALIWTATLLVHFPMFIEPRFWVPAMPFLLVNAAMGLDWTWRLFTVRCADG